MAHVGGIGRGLNVDDHAAKVFVEAEIRASVVFQLSRILTAASKSVKKAMNAPPWTALQPGTASGTLVTYETIGALLNDIKKHKDHRIVAFLDNAEGDEDIPPEVAGIVLGHELPLLSHLGVRARQQGVVFACSDGTEAYESLKSSMTALWQKPATIEVSLSGQVIVRAGASSPLRTGADGVAAAGAHVPMRATIDLSSSADLSKTSVVACAAATEATCGAKCAAAREILGLVEKCGGADFVAPPGCALPFGVMVKAAKPTWAKYTEAADAFDAQATDGVSADRLAADMRAFIAKKWAVSGDLVADIQKHFPTKDAKVMVRSSANCEDLQKVSGAGLYDSIANVDVSDADALRNAVSLVWQSLWTKRAALSRRASGFKHSDAAMAVLVQQMVPADLSFIAFSANPISRDPDQVYVEMCVGMGETLASAAQPGTPYRFTYDKSTKAVAVLAVSSFSKALVPPSGNSFDLDEIVIDYSTIPLHTDPVFRDDLVSRIAKAVSALADARGCEQDVEGVILLEGAEAVLHIVQTRPMVLAD